MLSTLDSIPFNIENSSHGLTEVQGLMRVENHHLVLEYRTADTILGLVKTELKEVWIPLVELESIVYRKRFFGLHRRLVIKARKQSSFGAFPESKLGQIELHIQWRDRTAAEDFCLELQQGLLRRKNEMLAREIDRELGTDSP